MTKKFEILLSYQNIALDLPLETYLPNSNFLKIKLGMVNFKELPNNLGLILIHVEDLTQSLTIFLRKLKSTKFANIPTVALLDKNNENFTKNIIKLGFSNFIPLSISKEEIISNLKVYIENFRTKNELFSKLSVAIIDDDFLHNELIKRMLYSNSVQKITTFQSADDFLKSPVSFDLFLVDLVMKDINGIALIKKISALFPDALIFIISSLTEERIIATTFEAGADDFIIKPIKPFIFLAKIFSRTKKRNYFLNNNKI